ncbi:hypothetical protein C8J57DRAFT_1259531 [Mycena rebaudengoi]|nr:hypothetical protein C8J57DRAFT_1259531 [Mycena rebaudengoi]
MGLPIDGAAPSSSSNGNAFDEGSARSDAKQAHKNLLITALSIMCILEVLLSSFCTYYYAVKIIPPQEQSVPDPNIPGEAFHLDRLSNYNKLPVHTRAIVPATLAPETTANALGAARPSRIELAEKYVRNVVRALVEDPTLDVPGAFVRTPGAPPYMPPPYTEEFFNSGSKRVRYD